MVGKRSLYHARGSLPVFRTGAHCIKAGFHFHRDNIGLSSTARLNASEWLQRSKQNWSKFTSRLRWLRRTSAVGREYRLSGNGHSKSALLYARLALTKKPRWAITQKTNGTGRELKLACRGASDGIGLFLARYASSSPPSTLSAAAVSYIVCILSLPIL